VSNDDRFDLVDWLTFKRRLDLGKARWMGPFFAVVATLLVVLAIGAAFTLLGRALFGGLLDIPGSSLGVGGVTVALIGAPFVIWRSIVAQKQADIAEQGQIIDRINKAVEGLGHEYAAVRTGAILSFEKIMTDSPIDRIMVLKMLNAYIEHHQPAETGDEVSDIRDTSIDVQAALDVLLRWRT
jgi:hypothetical protein